MMKIKKLNRLISEIATELLGYFKSNGNATVIQYENGNLVEEFESIFCHKGLYQGKRIKYIYIFNRLHKRLKHPYLRKYSIPYFYRVSQFSKNI